MSITVKTADLRSMASHVGKIIIKDPNMPLTGFVSVESTGKQLQLTVTDMVQTLTTNCDVASKETWQVMVSAEIFLKLVEKLTKEETTLELNDSGLHITSNGSYTLEVAMDDDGQVLKHPMYEFNKRAKNVAKSKEASVFDKIVKTHKAALSDDQSRPYLGGYYFDDNAVLTTSGYVLTFTETPVFSNPTLLSSRVLDLLATLYGEVSIKEQDGKYLFVTKTATLHAPALGGIDLYPIQQIQPMVVSGYGGMVTISRNELIGALGRLTLFASEYDTNDLTIAVGKNGLQLADKAQAGVEVVPYAEKPKDLKEYICTINADTLRKQAATIQSTTIEFHYDNERSVKMKDADTVQIVTLIADAD